MPGSNFEPSNGAELSNAQDDEQMLGYESINDIQMSVQVVDPRLMVSVPTVNMFSPQQE